ncbi:MAG TPA: nucleotidyl transferase AbiEii/AbiGii toxin family protein [Thermoleophilia bacterium]|nr:nucleotidyl transferase AbiEii/AbiGii toxin family protein [Thermoleophilia bacterium]
MTAFPHSEALDGRTASLLSRIAGEDAFRDFYLAGETALALQLGHRMSLDLDLFSERPWSAGGVLDAARSLGPTTVDLESAGTLVGSIGGVRVSSFHYPYPLLEPPLRFPGVALGAPPSIPLAGLLDIACMKLVAVSQRGSRKDFIDLYFLDRAGIDVRPAVQALPRKILGVDHNLVHLIRSLAYFAGAESEPEPRMLVPFEWRQARDYALAESQTLLQEVLGPSA